jgi:hypothetical protein
VFSFNKTFVDHPTNEYELTKDPNLDDEINTIEFKRAFSQLLFDRYYKFISSKETEIIPEEVKNSKKDWVGDESETNFIEKLKLDYEFTNNIDNFVTSAQISGWISDQKLGITMKKFSIEMKRYCEIKKLDKIESVQKKINGKNIKIWLGIKNVSSSLV